MGSRKCWSDRTPYREAHCAHKTMGWWKLAKRWPSRWYGKTDDDAVIDLPPLLRFLREEMAAIPGPVFGGIVHYSSLNTTNLEGACFASGGLNAIKSRRRRCSGPEFAGPCPYVEGPLEILSPEVMRFLSEHAAVDPRQRCHYEDLYVGIAIAGHASLSLVNLERLLGRKDVYIPGRREFVGADSMLAHWVRSEDAFKRVVNGFERTRGLRSRRSNALQCAPWASAFPPLRDGFPCCHDWHVCEPITPLLRHRATPVNNSFLPAN